jgi:hypothetical protein
MIEIREISNQIEEIYISKGRVSILAICDFQGRFEDKF